MRSYLLQTHHQISILILFGIVALVGGWLAWGKEYFLEQRAQAIGGTTTHHLSVDLGNTLGKISENLVGINFVYSSEADAVHEGDRVALWAKQAGLGPVRFPGGGTIKQWNWENPSGYLMLPHMDPWDPEFDASKRVPGSSWMSLDEYLRFLSISGATPLIGVNTVSALVFDRINESVLRAKRQVEYIVSKGYRGAFYYLNNEDEDYYKTKYPKDDPTVRSAENFKRHAVAIKEADPEAKLIWNMNHPVNGEVLKKFLLIAGPYVDGIEFHNKWRHGAWVPGTGPNAFGGFLKENHYVADWQTEYPIDEEKHAKMKSLRAAATALGYPNLLMMDNEYGILHSDNFPDFTPFTKALLIVDLTQRFFTERWDMAVLWPGVFDKSMGLINNTDYSFTPVKHGFELLGDAQGKMLLNVVGTNTSASGFAVLDGNIFKAYLLNKTNDSNPIVLNVTGGRLASSGIKKTMVDTEDHAGRINEEQISIFDNTITTVLPALSFTKIIVNLSLQRIYVAPDAETQTTAVKPAEPESTTPVVKQFAIPGNQGKVIRGVPAKFVWLVEQAHKVNIVFDCDNTVVPVIHSGTKRLPASCKKPAFEELPLNGEVEISFLSKDNKDASLKINLVPQNEKGELLDTFSKTISLRVTPAHFTESLYFGMENSEQVAFLQQYLKTRPELYPEGKVTGYYGEATRRAVGRLQEFYKLGDSSTPGFGGVGVRTREVLNKLTGGQ